MPLPDGLVGWHLLMRAGIPQWQIPTVKSACGNNLEPRKLEEVLKHMFGADSRPHHKDVQRSSMNTGTADALIADDDYFDGANSYSYYPADDA